MVRYAIAAFAGLAAALPLNINLGAYSPALVVGMFLPLTFHATLERQERLPGRQVMVKSALEVGRTCRI
jgi:hypothetical protein